MLDPEKNIQASGSRMAGKRYYDVGFYKYIFHNGAILQIFEGEFRESVLDILSYPESTIGPVSFGLKKSIFKVRFSDGWKALTSDWFLQIQCLIEEPCCKYLKQNLPKVFCELKLQSSEYCTLVEGNAKHASVIQGYFPLWMIHFSRTRHVHDSIARVHVYYIRNHFISNLVLD